VLVPQFIAALTTTYWGPKPRVIPVSFLDDPDVATRDLILSHMAAAVDGTSLSFAWSAADGKVRITRAGRIYASYLGTDVLMIRPGEPTMWLGGITSRTSDAECRRVIRHETLHTAGCPHEHMRRDLVARIDREKAVVYFAATQGWSRRDVEQQVLTPLDEASVMGTPADQTSIMCYQLPGSITIDGMPIEGGADLNDSDRAFLRSIYPKADPFLPPTPPPPTPGEGEMLAELNRARAASGLPTLVEDARLSASAGSWAATMAASGMLIHGDSAARIGPIFPGRAHGEVIAAGQSTAAQAVGDWLSSPGHRRQILGPYDVAGHGSARAADGTTYWVADFVDSGGVGPSVPPPPLPPVRPEPPPPVRPPDPERPDPPVRPDPGAIPLKIGVESGPHRYRPPDPLRFRFTAHAPKVFAVELSGVGRWVIDLDGVAVEAKRVTARLEPGPHALTVYRAIQNFSGSCHVKVSAASSRRRGPHDETP
jgi:hypothetical protein